MNGECGNVKVELVRMAAEGLRGMSEESVDIPLLEITEAVLRNALLSHRDYFPRPQR